MTDHLERCSLCDCPTGRAGRSDDSIFINTERGEVGPLCPECLTAIGNETNEELLDTISRQAKSFTRATAAHREAMAKKDRYIGELEAEIGEAENG